MNHLPYQSITAILPTDTTYGFHMIPRVNNDFSPNYH